MKILLDQSAPRKLAQFLTQHEVKHTEQVGWEEIANGKLLKLAEENGYTLLITSDQNIPYQNSVAGRSIGILALSTNNWPLMKPYVADIVQAVDQVKPGEGKTFSSGSLLPRSSKSPTVSFNS